jgi:peroxiredoxin
MKEGMRVPETTFKKRVRDESIGGDNPFKWVDVTTEEIFSGNRVLVFALPGAYTPTCSTYQVPGFVQQHKAIKALGVDSIYVLSVNDTFVMRKWLLEHDCAGKIDFIPDGNAEFTKGMGMDLDMSVVGFGTRSRRYAMIVNDGVIEKMFAEPDATENDPDPYGVSSPESVMEYLSGKE